MKKVYSRIPWGVLVTLLLSIALINGIAIYFDFSLIPNSIKVASVLILLTFYFMIRNQMANVFLTIFILILLGNIFSVFSFGDMSNKLSQAFYLGSYLLLMFVMFGSLKEVKFERIVSVYLILVLLLNSYFLYMLYGLIKDNFTDEVNLILYLMHGIILIAMAFFAFAVYLVKETKQSILFLIMVCCLVFSDVLNYICNQYVYFWVFDYVGNMLHLGSLCLFYMYVMNHKKSILPQEKASQEFYTIQNSENLTA